MKRLRCGVAGLATGWGYASAFHTDSRCDLSALADLNKGLLNKGEKEFGVKAAFHSYEDLCKMDELDLVMLSLPHFLHRDSIMLALKHGKHVFSEKPLVTTGKDARDILSAQKKAGKKVIYGCQRRFGEIQQTLKLFIDRGELGQIYHARTGWLRRYWFNKKSPWRNSKKLGGGPLLDLGVHMLDTTLWYMGFPEPVEAAAAKYYHHTRKGVDVETFVSAQIRFANNASLIIQIGEPVFVRKETDFCELLGTKGGASENPLIIHTSCRGKMVDLIPQTGEDSWANSCQRLCQEFVNSVINGTEPPNIVEEAIVIADILDAIELSAQKGKAVKIGPAPSHASDT